MGVCDFCGFHYLLHLTALVLIVFSYWRFGFWNGLRDTLLIGFVWWLLTWVTTTLTVTLVRMLDPTSTLRTWKFEG